jgi:hypothetical protein
LAYLFPCLCCLRMSHFMFNFNTKGLAVQWRSIQ